LLTTTVARPENPNMAIAGSMGTYQFVRDDTRDGQRVT